MTHETQRRIEEEADKRYKARTPETPSKFVRIFQKVFEQGATFGYNLANEWVKVEEPPKEDGLYLCKCEARPYVLSYHIEDNRWYMDFKMAHYFEDWTQYVTHWQPLPTPTSE